MPKRKKQMSRQEELALQVEIDKWYKIAVARHNRSSKQMVEDALLCFQALTEKSDVGLEILTEEWGYSAKAQARAVQRHPEYFQPNLKADELPSRETLLILYKIATLPLDKDKIIFALWQEKHLPKFRIDEEVAAINHRHPRFSRQVLAVPEADLVVEEDEKKLKVERLVATPSSDHLIKPPGLPRDETYEIRVFRRDNNKGKAAT